MESPPELLSDSDEKDTTKPVTCCTFFCADIRTPAFSLREPNGSIIDVTKSFVPSSTWSIVLMRAAFLIYTIVTITVGIVVESKERWLWIGFLTSWSAIFTFVYQGAVFACTMKPDLLLQPEIGEIPNWWTRFLWGMYSLATTFEMCIVFQYWGLLYEKGNEITFYNVSSHGVLAAFLLFDGLVVATIPVRVRHLLISMLTAVIYLTWQIIHAYSGIGLRRENNVGAPLYDVLDWREDPLSATILSLLTIFVMVPLFFFIIWIGSIYSFPFRFNGSNRKVIGIIK